MRGERIRKSVGFLCLANFVSDFMYKFKRELPAEMPNVSAHSQKFRLETSPWNDFSCKEKLL